MPLCCCCGFKHSRGIYFADAEQAKFACTRCFSNPSLFFSAKRVLPHWTLAVKSGRIVNRFAKKDRGSGEEQVFQAAYLTKKSKRELSTSESLYDGQKQLFNFGGSA